VNVRSGIKGVADWQPIRTLFAALSRPSVKPEAFRLELDLDPVNML